MMVMAGATGLTIMFALLMQCMVLIHGILAA